MSKPERAAKPMDRLTRICDAMTQAMDASTELAPDDKAIIFLMNGHNGGMVLHRYNDDVEAMTDLLIHLQALFNANDKQMSVMFMDDDGNWSHGL